MFVRRRKARTPSNRRRQRLIALALLVIATLAYGGRALRQRSRVHWRPPHGEDYDGALHARILGDDGPPIVFLHGLLGSADYWGADYEELAQDHRLIVPDLLGFGKSPKPESGYTADDQALALLALLDELEIRQPVVLVAHSLGSLVALRLAVLAPDRVASIVAFGPPLYSSQDSALKRIANLDPLAGMLTLDHPLARNLCRWFHDHQGVATVVVRALRPELPRDIARGTTQHTWESYWGTMSQVVLAADGNEWLEGVSVPVRFVVGSLDQVADLGYLETLTTENDQVTLEVVDGRDHGLPLTDPLLCRSEIGAMATASPLPKGSS